MTIRAIQRKVKSKWLQNLQGFIFSDARNFVVETYL